MTRAKKRLKNNETEKKILEDWQPNIFDRIYGYEAYIKENAPTVLFDTVLVIEKNKDKHSNSNRQYSVTFKWKPEHISEKFGWTFSLRGPRIKIDEKTVIVIGSYDKDDHSFDEDLTLYGGGEYELKFSPLANLIKYTKYSILGGVLTYVWIL